MAKYVNLTKVITGPDTRWSYCNAWEPKAINGGTPKYSVSLISPKSDTKTIEKVRAAMNDEIPEERETAIFMNFVLMSKCAEIWVFGDVISAGMQHEINRAKRKYMKIRYFTEELEEK